MNPRRAFTLIELLVVVTIIGVLAAMLLAAVGRARGRARQITCMSNLRQLGTALMLYADDYNETLPSPSSAFGDSNCWLFAIDPYLGTTVGAERKAVIKQDPIWGSFSTGTQTISRTIKMNRKLVGHESEGANRTVTNATPMQRRISGVRLAPTTPLLFDGAVEQTTINGAPSRYDGWEVHVQLRHSGGANILFMDGHAQLWTTGTVASNGWDADSTGLDWWVE